MRSRSFFQWRLPLIVVVFLLAGHHANAQSSAVADQSCAGIDLEREDYSVRSSHINDPFEFLPWVKAREKNAAAQISALIDQKPFRYEQVIGQSLKIIEDQNFLPDTSETRVKLRVLVVRVANCTNKSVDVIYGVYSTQLMPVLSAAPESRVEERKEPEQSAGLVNVNVPDSRPVRFMPHFAYDATDKFSGGGRFEFTRKSGGRFFTSASVEGEGSSDMHTIVAKLKGAADDVGWLAHLDWNIEFENSSLPTDSGTLKRGNLLAQFEGATRPLANGALFLRFGGRVESGNRQSELTNVHLTPDTVSNSPYGALKLFVGAASRFKNNSLSASYGLQLGTASRSINVDWTKQIGDIRHEFWSTIGDHHSLDLESRLTLGHIHIRNEIPVAERFFGGNHEQTFMTSDAWEIRANPVIRAIPGSSLFRTPFGAGGDNFFSYNLTAAYAIWRRALVPTELSKDPEFKAILDGQLTSAEEFEKLHFLTKDKHFEKTAEFIKEPQTAPQLQSALTALSTAVATAQSAHPGQHENEFQECLSAIRRAASRAKNGEKAKGEKLYGYVAALLSVDEDLLNEVNNACITTLNGSAVLNGNPTIAAAGSRVEQIRQMMEAEFAKIDESAAVKKSKEDMIFTRHTITTLMNDVNLYSVSPLFVFDVARLSEKSAGFGGVRYGPGAGLRLELVSAVNFSAGYAWNTNRGPGEAKGSFFFSMGLRDLFR